MDIRGDVTRKASARRYGANSKKGLGLRKRGRGPQLTTGLGNHYFLLSCLVDVPGLRVEFALLQRAPVSIENLLRSNVCTCIISCGYDNLGTWTAEANIHLAPAKKTTEGVGMATEFQVTVDCSNAVCLARSVSAEVRSPSLAGGFATGRADERAERRADRRGMLSRDRVVRCARQFHDLDPRDQRPGGGLRLGDVV
jgi:hypothetical protein